jgi:AmpE protein
VGAVARGALRRWFGVLFWFLLLGPVGALGYRLVQLAADASLSTARPASARDAAGVALAVLEWPVAQLMTLALALVGNFDTVFAAWREARLGRPALDSGFLEAAARASVTAEIADDEAWATEGLPADAPPALLELRDAMSLVWRMLMVWLAVLALFVLAGWVG